MKTFSLFRETFFREFTFRVTVLYVIITCLSFKLKPPRVRYFAMAMSFMLWLIGRLFAIDSAFLA
jgi:hypothetical protein